MWAPCAFTQPNSTFGRSNVFAFKRRTPSLKGVSSCVMTPRSASGVDSKSRHSNGCETGFRAGFPELPLDDETFRIRLDVKIFRVEFRG